MNPGEMITCPHCGERSVVKLRKNVSGWQISGEELVCALCSGVLGSPEQQKTAPSAARNKLAALLGGDDTEKVDILPGDEYRKGCRNCANLLEHPFKLLCAKTQLEVDPMHVCDDFADRNCGGLEK